MKSDFAIRTSTRTQLIDITATVRDFVAQTEVESGTCTVFVPHTTAAVTINENADPSVKTDITAKLSKLIPHRDDYQHLEGNSDAHVKSTLTGASVTRGTRYWLVVECLADPGSGTYKSPRGHDTDVFPDGRYLYHRSGGSWNTSTRLADMSVFMEYDDPLPGPGGRIAGNTIDIGDDPALAHYVSGVAKASKSYDVAKGCVIERNYFDLGSENYRVAIRPANGWIIVLNRFYEATSANDMAYGIWVSSARLPYYASSVIACLNSFQGSWADGTCVFMSATNYSVNAFNDMQGGSPRYKSWADAGNFHLFETVTAVMQVKWTGDGTNNRLLSISDHGVSTYHFILVFPDESLDYSTVHCAMAWDFWGAHGMFDNSGAHRSGIFADPFWQGRSYSQLKLGSAGVYGLGTNYSGRKYKALVISLSGIGSKTI